MSSSSHVPAEHRYDEWQGLLAEAFFSKPGIPVVLFAADDELDRMAPVAEGCSAAESLAYAVLPFVRLKEGGNMFASLRVLRAVWRADPAGPPPTLPVLALTVLAATRMRRDTQASAANYYLRMAQALLPDGEAREVEEARLHMLAAFERDIVPMWRELHDWMRRGNGEAGVSTVRSHPHWTNIGYPLSQALVRASDKALLTGFFAAIDVLGRGVPAQGPLLEYLRLWSARHQSLSDTLRSALEEESLADMIAPIIAGLAASWDGQVVTPEGRRRLDVRLVMDLESCRSRWLLALNGDAAPKCMSGKVGASAYTVSVRPAMFGGYAALENMPPPSGALVNAGFRIDGSGAAAEFTGSKLVALKQNPDAGGWVSCDGIEPYCDHVLAAHPELSAAVRAVLGEAADDGWTPVHQRAGETLLAGYSIFRRVRFSDENKLNVALRRIPGAAQRALRPAVTARPRLASGLPLMRAIASRVYLAGGEPDLLLPVAEQARTVTVSLDGAPQQFLASGFPIPLSVVPGIGTGEHALDVDGETLTFTVLSRSPGEGPVDGTGSLHWEVTTGTLLEGLEGVGIRGAIAPQSGAYEPLLVRRGASESWWLHFDGGCSPCLEPEPAPLLVGLGLSSLFHEADPPRTAAWLVQKRRRGWGPPVLLRRHPPEFRLPTEESRRIWTELTRTPGPRPTEDGAGLWALYARAWGLVSER